VQEGAVKLLSELHVGIQPYRLITAFTVATSPPLRRPQPRALGPRSPTPQELVHHSRTHTWVATPPVGGSGVVPAGMKLGQAHQIAQNEQMLTRSRQFPEHGLIAFKVPLISTQKCPHRHTLTNVSSSSPARAYSNPCRTQKDGGKSRIQDAFRCAATS